MNKRHYEHTLPNIRGSLSNTYVINSILIKTPILIRVIYNSVFPDNRQRSYLKLVN